MTAVTALVRQIKPTVGGMLKEAVKSTVPEAGIDTVSLTTKKLLAEHPDLVGMMAKCLSEFFSVHPGCLKKGLLDEAQLVKHLTTGQALPLQKGIILHYGVVLPNGHVITDSADAFRHLGEHLSKKVQLKKPLPLIFAENADPRAAYNATKTFNENVLIPYAQTTVKGRPITVAWHFLEDLMTGRANPIGEDIAKLLEIPACTLHFSSQTPVDLTSAIHKAFLPLRQRLLASHSAQEFYQADQHFMDAAKAGGTGALIGAIGGYGAEHLGGSGLSLLTKEGMSVFGIRQFTGIFADVVENWFGLLGNVAQECATNNIPFNKRIFVEFIMNPKSTKHPAFKVLRDALGSATKGSLVGLGSSIPASLALTAETSVPVQAAAGFLGTAGTSASIPIALRTSYQHMILAVQDQIKCGKIKLPPNIMEGTKEYDSFIHKTASREMEALVGNKASAGAFLSAPIIGASTLASQALGVPGEFSRWLYTTFGPPMENVLKPIFVMSQNAAHKLRAKRVRNIILNTSNSKSKDTTQAIQTVHASKAVTSAGIVGKILNKSFGKN